jgi:hypothetical protein
LLHRNRVLQSMAIRGDVGQPPTRDYEIVRAQLGELDCRTRANLAIAQDGERSLAVAGDKASRIDIADADIKQLVDVFDAVISAIKAKPEAYESLRSEASQELLRELAKRGGKLYSALTKHALIDERFGQPDLAIQIVSKNVGRHLPLELAYSHDVPDADAKVCDCAEAALTFQANSATDRTPCQRGTVKRICPLGFLGMQRSIERHAHTPEHYKEPSAFTLRYEPIARESLGTPSRIVLGLHENAMKFDPKLVENEPRFAKATQIETWDALVDAMSKAPQPELQVLFPHHGKGKYKVDVLEIGQADQLETVRADHVRGKQAQARPIVLLIGCETQLATISYENFAISFKDEGAAFVVSTIATVLGRSAIPVGARLTEELCKVREEPALIGAVLRDVRRAELANGRVMVLALTAYGDADCRIG